jgi:hypothetical protein
MLCFAIPCDLLTIDRRTFTTTLRKTSKPKQQKAVKANKKPVLLIRRQIDDKGRFTGTEVDIVSTALQEVVTEMNEDVLGFNLSGSRGTVSLSAFLV